MKGKKGTIRLTRPDFDNNAGSPIDPMTGGRNGGLTTDHKTRVAGSNQGSEEKCAKIA